jgi:Uma2 family endonuclease
MPAHDPDILCTPDVAFVRAERIPAPGVPLAFWKLAPDLAVEVTSPGESASDVRDKVRDYLVAGTLLVWQVYPRIQEVIVHTPNGIARSYNGDVILEAPDVLPGFTCVVAELFA